MDNLTYEVVDVTPAVASSWLLKNTKNRTVRERTVSRYASDMTEGRWLFTGEAVKFDGNGQLIDGQHRLLAVMRAGLSVPMLVVHGLQHESQEVLDGGIKRTLKDSLRLRGEANYNILAPSLRYFWIEDSGKSFTAANSEAPSVAQALSTLERHPEAREGASAAAGATRATNLTMSIYAYRWCQFATIDQDDRDDFFYRIKTMSFRGESDPLRHFVSLLQQEKSRTKRLHRTMDIHALMVKTWNYYRSGREIRVLSWKRGGSSPERFPEAI